MNRIRENLLPFCFTWCCLVTACDQTTAPLDSDADSDESSVSDADSDNSSDVHDEADGSGPIFTDACLNHDDENELSRLENLGEDNDMHAISIECGQLCMFRPSDEEKIDCTLECFAEGDGRPAVDLTDECAYCFAAEFVCTVNHCMFVCKSGSERECQECSEENCEDDFERCSGVS